jgi:hypothetical protein
MGWDNLSTHMAQLRNLDGTHMFKPDEILTPIIIDRWFSNKKRSKNMEYKKALEKVILFKILNILFSINFSLNLLLCL